MPDAPAFVPDDPESECEAVLAGIGFGQIPADLALPHLRQERLESVLEHLSPDPWELYVYRPQRAPGPVRVRLVHDTLVEVLANPARFPAEL
ncbi:MAG: hypothetical protein JNJ60_21920 [Rhodocyclaceae bacterium]|nr:hypothetical protein [Rhodocyclaceae bacterium]